MRKILSYTFFKKKERKFLGYYIIYKKKKKKIMPTTSILGDVAGWGVKNVIVGAIVMLIFLL